MLERTATGAAASHSAACSTQRQPRCWEGQMLPTQRAFTIYRMAPASAAICPGLRKPAAWHSGALGILQPEP